MFRLRSWSRKLFISLSVLNVLFMSKLSLRPPIRLFICVRACSVRSIIWLMCSYCFGVKCSCLPCTLRLMVRAML